MSRKGYEEGLRSLVLYHPGTLANAYEAMIESYVIELEDQVKSMEKEIAKLRREIQREAANSGEAH